MSPSVAVTVAPFSNIPISSDIDLSVMIWILAVFRIRLFTLIWNKDQIASSENFYNSKQLWDFKDSKMSMTTISDSGRAKCTPWSLSRGLVVTLWDTCSASYLQFPTTQRIHSWTSVSVSHPPQLFSWIQAIVATSTLSQFRVEVIFGPSLIHFQPGVSNCMLSNLCRN